MTVYHEIQNAFPHQCIHDMCDYIERGHVKPDSHGWTPYHYLLYFMGNACDITNPVNRDLRKLYDTVKQEAIQNAV